MTLGTSIYTLFCGRLIGQDGYGNRYYTSKRVSPGGKLRRWVMYKDQAEPSLVPAQWHGWLHYRTDTPPTERPTAHYPWMKGHTPNYSGTPLAYLPSGHPLKGGKRPPATGDYESWQP